MNEVTSVQLDEQHEEDYLVELVTLPHWKLLRKIVGKRLTYLHARIREPAETFPDDFYRKEQLASEARALENLVREVESLAERAARNPENS